MDRQVAENGDPWGIRAERDAEQVSLSRPACTRLRRPGRVGVSLFGTLVLAVVALALPALPSSAARLPRSGPVQVTKGPGALYGDLSVVGASGAGVLVQPVARTANGGRSLGPAEYSVVPAGKHAAVALMPKLESASYLIEGAGISGPLVVLWEEGSGMPAVWWYDISTKKSGLVLLKEPVTFEGAVPGGVLVSESGVPTSSLVEIALPSRKPTTLLKFPESEYVTALTGPSGVVTVGSSGVKETVGYVLYAAPRHLVTLFHENGVSITCDSLSTLATGCTILKGSASSIASFDLSGTGHFIKKVGTGYPYPSTVVTPKVTAWFTCSNTGCPLHRVLVQGGKISTYPLPIVASVVSVGDLLYFSPSNDTTSGGGLFSLLDTAKKATHLAPGYRSPLAAAAISVGTNSIAWIDNGASGLGVWTSTYSAAGSSVKLGKPKLLGGDGFLDSDSTAYSLDIADSGSAVASTSYAKQPSADPLDITVFEGGQSKVLSNLGDWSAYSGATLGVSGDDVLFQTLSGFDLGDFKTAKVTTLPMTDIATYALGGGKLAYIKTDGSVWVESVAGTGAKQLAPPLSGGESFEYVDGLSVASDGSRVAWAYGWYSAGGSGQVTQYVSAGGGTPTDIPVRTGLVSVVSISPKVIGVGYAQESGGSELWAMSLPSGTWKEYAPVVYGLSIGGNVAAWIGANGLPYVERV
ncbi:MAG: hypothetical protein ACLQK4_00240 [Acidimicrobiales bacterium]|jgi:hypothetical protein